MDANFSQVAGELAHIYVHSAGILAAEGCQGAGVVRNHGNIKVVFGLHRFIIFSLVDLKPFLYNPDHATVAQLVEQTFRKRQVMGSIPFGGFLI